MFMYRHTYPSPKESTMMIATYFEMRVRARTHTHIHTDTLKEGSINI